MPESTETTWNAWNKFWNRVNRIDVLLGFVFLLIFGIGGYLVGHGSATISSQNSREIALLASPTPTITLVPSPVTYYPLPTTDLALTANWKTYKDVEFAFSFRYPSRLKIKDVACLTAALGYCPARSLTLEPLDAEILPSGLTNASDLNFQLVIDSIDHFANGFVDYNTGNEKEEGIKLDGKIGRIASVTLPYIRNIRSNNKDNIGIPIRDIDVPLNGKIHFRLHFKEDLLTLNEFNQMLSTFKFIDQQ
jgi:hypothetical protein